MTKSSTFIKGTCLQLLFSPKGDVEGALVKRRGALVQVTVERDLSHVFADAVHPGRALRVRAMADHSPKTASGMHPVYQFKSFADGAGKAVKMPDDHPRRTTIKGIVASLHFARHGQANGVILETGEFIHLRPRGMVEAELKVGSAVKAIGAMRMTQLGTRLLEAHQVNRIKLH